MFKRLKDTLDYYWAQNSLFRFAAIAAILVLITVAAFLTWYIFKDYSLITVIVLLVLLGIAYGKGYGKRGESRLSTALHPERSFRGAG